jgi:transglutaminase-like putative cysteine protease
MTGSPADFDRSILQLDESAIAVLDLLDHRGVNWSCVRRTAYLIHQHLRYEYPGPIEDLRHRLVIVPPERYGDQRRVFHKLEVSAASVETRSAEDPFGNVVIAVSVPRVEQAIDFEAWIVVERRAGGGPHRLPAAWLVDPRLREPSRLTQPDVALRAAAARLAGGAARGLDLAARINAWVYETLRYAPGVTGVKTTAAEALALRQGVCQDYAHAMLALCRLCDLPARYVSGHLLGEGGTHAWVEVLLPAEDAPDSAVAVAFDPTHARRAGLSYVTVAVGRDYLDVAPTSGAYRAAYGGQLSARKRVGLAAVEYASGG